MRFLSPAPCPRFLCMFMLGLAFGALRTESRDFASSAVMAARVEPDALPLRSITGPGLDLPLLAVVDFHGNGVLPPDAATVSDRLSKAFETSKHFRAMSRDSVAKWQNSDARWSWRPCTEWECAVKAGVVLKVDRVLMGEVQNDGSAWILTTRMMEVATATPLRKMSFRTEKGFLDLLDRGVATVASDYAAAETRRDSLKSMRTSVEPQRLKDPVSVAALEDELQRLRLWSGASAIGALGAAYVGGSLFVANSTVCVFSGEGVCKEPDRGPEHLWIASSVVLGVVAIVTGAMAIERSRHLRVLKEKSALDVSWAPLVDPRSKATGLQAQMVF